MVMHGFHKAYQDSVMEIWEVPAPAPYYEVMQGGPCTLTTERREDVTAVCSSPAKLRRRELYMPGWNVRKNGAAIEAVRQDGIFQGTSLPAGPSKVHYNFTPSSCGDWLGGVPDGHGGAALATGTDRTRQKRREKRNVRGMNQRLSAEVGGFRRRFVRSPSYKLLRSSGTIR